MRLVLVALVLLATSTAYADRPPFEVVRVLPETGQVLIYDAANNTHVLLKPGESLYDYVIVEISGAGLIVQKQQEQIAMYPRGVRGIAINLEQPGAVQPPVIYGKVSPVAPTQTSVAALDTHAVQVAAELASLLTSAPVTRAPRAPSPFRELKRLSR